MSFGSFTKYNKKQNIYEIHSNAEDKMNRMKLFESPSMRGRTISTIIKTLHEKNTREESFLTSRGGRSGCPRPVLTPAVEQRRDDVADEEGREATERLRQGGRVVREREQQRGHGGSISAGVKMRGRVANAFACWSEGRWFGASPRPGSRGTRRTRLPWASWVQGK